VLLDRRVEVEATDARGATRHHASHRDDGHLRASSTDVDDQVPQRFVDGQVGTDGGGERLLDRHDLPPTREADRPLDRASFHAG
jgi:hypothetical protein